MKGKLHYRDGKWTITYITSDPKGSGRWVRIAELPLHPDDVDSVSGQYYIDDEHQSIHIYDGRNVEFEIQNDYAKLKQ